MGSFILIGFLLYLNNEKRFWHAVFTKIWTLESGIIFYMGQMDCSSSSMSLKYGKWVLWPQKLTFLKRVNFKWKTRWIRFHRASMTIKWPTFIKIKIWSKTCFGVICPNIVIWAPDPLKNTILWKNMVLNESLATCTSKEPSINFKWPSFITIWPKMYNLAKCPHSGYTCAHSASASVLI